MSEAKLLLQGPINWAELGYLVYAILTFVSLIILVAVCWIIVREPNE